MIDNEPMQIIGAASESKEKRKSDKKREMRKERPFAAIMCNHDNHAVAQRESAGTGLYPTHPLGAIPALPLSLCT